MSDNGEKFIQEFVLIFGFLGGILFRVGVDPEGTIVEALSQSLYSINPGAAALLSILFTVFSIVVFILTILAAFNLGGWLGIFAIILGFAAGILLNEISVVLLFIAIIFGYISPYYSD